MVGERYGVVWVSKPHSYKVALEQRPGWNSLVLTLLRGSTEPDIEPCHQTSDRGLKVYIFQSYFFLNLDGVFDET